MSAKSPPFAVRPRPCPQSTVSNGLAILRALVDYRPPGQMEYLQKLLELTVAQNQEVRLQSAKHAKQLHERGNFRPIIEVGVAALGRLRPGNSLSRRGLVLMYDAVPT